MLYKKYHRGFVRKFKKGAKINKFGLDERKVEILAKPSIGKIWQGIFIETEPFFDISGVLRIELTLVFESGRLNRVIKNVV